MTAQGAFFVFAAGVIGGVANAMAGGASLVTFPALMAVGLPPIAANATNSVVVVGNLVAAWQERNKLPQLNRALVLSLTLAMICGALGAALLLVTTERVFVLLVPALIAAATLLFAFAKPFQRWMSRVFDSDSSTLRLLLVAPTAIYGGYFGAGLGVMYMAVLSATSHWDLRTTNAFKNLLGVATNLAAISAFVYWKAISWPEALVLVIGCAAGGLLGAKALQFVAPSVMRTVIIALGAAMAAFYAWRYWF